MRRIYLDHNASTPIHPNVRAAMERADVAAGGNPGSPHAEGRAARRIVEDARESTAAFLSSEPDEIVFTSGATESNASALRGIFAYESPAAPIFASAVEHACIMGTLDGLAKEGGEKRILPVNTDGRLDLRALEEALKGSCAGVAVMAVNNETGALQPIAEVASLCAAKGVPLHVDAAQTPGRVAIDWRDLKGRVSISLSGHKCGGPKGVGALRVPRTLRFKPVFLGGGQERDRRAGTENVVAIAGLAEALRTAGTDLEERRARLLECEDAFLSTLDARGVKRLRNGPSEQALRVPGVLNLRLPGRRGESVVLGLDLEGVAIGLGAACSSGAAKPSHVLAAMGLSKEAVLESFRVSFGWPDGAQSARDAAERLAKWAEHTI